MIPRKNQSLSVYFYKKNEDLYRIRVIDNKVLYSIKLNNTWKHILNKSTLKELEYKFNNFDLYKNDFKIIK